MTDSHPTPTRFVTRFRPWMVVLAVCLIYVTAAYFLNDRDPMTYIQPAEPPSSEKPEGYDGYDGQAVYLLALDWRTAPDTIDIPAYRFQRVFLSVVGWVFSLGGNPAILPFTLVAINIAALTGSVYLLELLLEAERISSWYALVYGLFAGLLMPVRLALTEPLAYGLVIAGIWLERNERPWWSAGAFALAALTKEPTLVFVAGYLLWMVLHGRWKDAFRLGLIASLPFIAWQIVLYLWLGEFGIGPGGGGKTPFEIIPFRGFVRIYTEGGSLLAFLALGAAFIPFSIYPSIWGVAQSVRDIFKRIWHPYVFLLLPNAAVIMITPFSTFREPLGITRFVPGLILSVLLYSAHFRKHGMLKFSLAWFYSLAWVFVSQ